MKTRKGIKTFTNIMGEKEPVLPELNPVAKLLNKRAKLHIAELELEQILGRQLAPILKEAEKNGDRDRLISMAQSLNLAGSTNSRFFWEAAYRIEKKKIIPAWKS